MPIIESVQVATVPIPLDVVTSFSTRTVSERHYCIVKVRSREGVEGIGFCYVGSAAGDIAKTAVEQLLAPKLIGQNSHRSEGLWNDMYAESILQGRAGSVMRGISILDTAIWDLNARSVGLPLHQFMGCVVDDRVPAYASGGYYLEGKTNPYWLEEPFSPDAIDLHARLAKSTSITIATGEIEVGRWRFRELVDAGGAGILQADAAVCGGISEFRRIAAYADSKGVTVCPHWFHDLHAPLVAHALWSSSQTTRS